MRMSISLNQNIECNYICGQIQKLVNKFQQSGENLGSALLVIDIVQPIDGGDYHIPKIEYKPGTIDELNL